MKRRILTLVSMLALTSCLMFAAAIDGKWTAQVDGKNGKVTETIMLQSNGTKLTGLVRRKGAGTEITEGTINGQNISFKIVRERKGKAVTQMYKGMLSGTDLKLNVSGGRDGSSKDVAFKKAK
jgi:hypothetical protein